MRIYIKGENGHAFRLALPTKMLLNRLTAGIIAKSLRSKVDLEKINISPKDINRICTELIKMKRKYPRLELVDILTHEGEIVKIWL